MRLGRTSEHGLKLIIARATAGDAIWFKATIDRIADILARQGDTDPVEVRRSKALGILAQPAEALQLLCQDQGDKWDDEAEPIDLEQEPAEAEVRSTSKMVGTPLPPVARVPTNRCSSWRRRLIRSGLGLAPWSMSISARKLSPLGPVWPELKASARCY